MRARIKFDDGKEIDIYKSSLKRIGAGMQSDEADTVTNLNPQEQRIVGVRVRRRRRRRKNTLIIIIVRVVRR